MTFADLNWAIEDVRGRLPAYDLARDYDEGRHRLLFATEKFRNTFGDLFREFADNMCDDVVDGITDRLQIVGWAAADKAVNQALDDYWERNKGASRAGAVHRNAFREGDGFTIVQTDRLGQARSWKQDPRLMAIRYSSDNPDEVEVAAKVWRQGKRYRVNLYYPGGLTEKWASKGVGADGALPQSRSFTILTAGDPDLADDQDSGIVVTDGAASDLAVPVFHYPNGEVATYGRSFITKVIPIQDALNKAVADMLVAMEFHAYPQRWATGVQVERNADGTERSPFQAGEGRLWRVNSKDAAFGQFDAATMEGFLDVQDSLRLEIARKGALPPHSVNLRSGGGNAPSGISLLVAEGKVIKLAKDRQRDWGYTHRAEAAYALTLEMNTQVLPEDLDLEWAPPETRDMKALLEELTLKRDLGVSQRQVLIEAGYSSDQVDEFLDEVEAEGADQAAALALVQGGRSSVTRGQARALESGIPAGPVPPNGAQSSLAQA